MRKTLIALALLMAACEAPTELLPKPPALPTVVDCEWSFAEQTVCCFMSDLTYRCGAQLVSEAK